MGMRICQHCWLLANMSVGLGNSMLPSQVSARRIEAGPLEISHWPPLWSMGLRNVWHNPCATTQACKENACMRKHWQRWKVEYQRLPRYVLHGYHAIEPMALANGCKTVKHRWTQTFARRGNKRNRADGTGGLGPHPAERVKIARPLRLSEKRARLEMFTPMPPTKTSSGRATEHSNT